MVQAVGAVGKIEGGDDGMVDLLGGPAAEMTAAMKEDFEQADNARIVDLDPRIADRANGDRQGEALQQRKVDMDIEPLRLAYLQSSGLGTWGCFSRNRLSRSGRMAHFIPRPFSWPFGS